MPAEKATAIVLRTVDFSESSLVLTLWTREYGKIRALAKGGRRLKGPFESALDLLTLCRIVFLRKSSDALDLLTEAKLLRRFRPAGRDLYGLYAGYYVAELLAGMTHDYQPHHDLFDLTDETLLTLAAGEPATRQVLRFELGLLRILGHLPLLEACVHCGGAVTTSGRVAFGQLDGGVLCSRCRPGRPQVASVSAGVVRMMARLADPNGQTWKRMEIDAASFGQLRGLLNQYIANLLGYKPRTAACLGSTSG
jgi:DNA repair protein RecO (recombination protein O)